MTASSPPVSSLSIARGALRLRAWARPLVLGDGPATMPPAAPPAAWSVFLATERCALPIRRRLDRDGAVDTLPAAAQSLLRVRAGDELQRVLGARVSAHQVARAAAACAGAVIVLAGGTMIFEDDAAVDVADLDVLVAPADAARLANALAASELRPDRGPATVSSRDLPGERDDGCAMIEVHYTLGRGAPAVMAALWSATAPLANAPGLHHLGGADHLGHVLARSAAAHPDRRGALRDLLVLQDAARATSPTERATALQALPEATHDVARALLDAAAADAPAPFADDFAPVAAANYLLRALSMRAAFGWMADPRFVLTAHAILGAADDRHRLVRTAGQRRAPVGGSTSFTRFAPRLASMARVALSVARLPHAGAVALAARRLARPYVSTSA